MEENEVLEQDTELSDELAGAFDSEWDDDISSDEGSESDDGPVEDTEPEEREEGQPDADHDSDAEEAAETSEEPRTETETGNQRFKIKYNGTEEEYDLDQMTTLAQKGRDYDHVREERDGLRGEAKNAAYQLEFLQDLADRAGLSVQEQIDRTRALWLMNDEFDKGNEISEAEALLRVQRNRNAASEQKEEPSKADEEVTRFMREYPGVKYEDIPKEVWDEANQTGELVAAYRGYELRQLKAENEKLKQAAKNERNAQRSTGPLKSTGSGQKKDAFDEGWDSE